MRDRRDRREPWTGVASAAKAKKVSGDDHGVGGGVAHRGVHQDGRRLPEGEPRHDGHVQLRRVVGAGAADPGRRARRRVRVGRRHQHAEAGVRGSGHRRADGVRGQRADHRGEEGQPGERQVAGRPRRPRRRLAVRGRGAVRQVRAAGADPGGRHHPAGEDHQGRRREGDARGGLDRRRRRGDRVHDRRQGGRQRACSPCGSRRG